MSNKETEDKFTASTKFAFECLVCKKRFTDGYIIISEIENL